MAPQALADIRRTLPADGCIGARFSLTTAHRHAGPSRAEEARASPASFPTTPPLKHRELQVKWEPARLEQILQCPEECHTHSSSSEYGPESPVFKQGLL